MQELQETTSTPKDKRSLRDIQEEEQARQQEADFLKWWAAEEERVRLEVSEQEQGRLMNAGAGTNHQNKNRGGKARPRRTKAETQPERNPSSVVTQHRESRGHRRPRQREDANA